MPKMGSFGSADVDALIAVHAALTATHGVAGAIADTAYPPSLLRYRLSGQYHSAFTAYHTTITLTTNRLYAIPFITANAKTITRIALGVFGFGSGASARLGIYADNGSIYPGSLVSDCGTVSMTSTGIKVLTGLNIALSANSLYWLVLVCNVAADIDACHANSQQPLLGYPTTDLELTGYGSYYVAFTYAALPSTYPESATPSNAAFPKIAVYF